MNMVKGFWKKLQKPIMALAPMADVTDAAFRYIIAKNGKPDVMFTEFVSCDGLSNEQGFKVLLTDFEYDESERPIVAQVFGSRPENFYTAALIVKELGFDGIDINMGCPDRNVEKQGAGAALIKNPELAQKIIKETKRGVGDLPVSVKTRIGYNKESIDEWIPYLLDCDIAALTVHGRTRKEMSDVPAHWDVIGRVADMVKKYDSSDDRTLVLGNGDVKNVAEAEEKVKQYGVDGVMIGRGIFGNPWLFSREVNHESVALNERLIAMIEHTLLFEDFFEDKKNFDIMKKHYKAYVNGFNGAKELRVKLMEAKNAVDVVRIVKEAFPDL